MSRVAAGLALVVVVATLEYAVAVPGSKPRRPHAKQTVPAVGGYSTTFKSGSTTVGIVSRMHGVAYLKLKSNLEVAQVGSGITKDTEFYVEENATLEVADLAGNLHTFIGPAVAQFTEVGTVNLLKGWLKQRAAPAKEETVRFETIYMSGVTSGQQLVLASFEKTQVFNLAASSTVWHPELRAAEALVKEGFFSEHSGKWTHLHPARPTAAEAKAIASVLTYFGEEYHPSIAYRSLAAEKAEEENVTRGTRKSFEVVEVRNPEIQGRLMAHLRGVDFEADTEEAFIEEESSEGQSRAGFEVTHVGRKLSKEHRAFLKRLKFKRRF